MITTILSSREFNQNIGKAKKSALQGPVFITDHGKISYVLLTIDGYRNISGIQINIADLLAMHEVDDIEFQPPKLNLTLQTM
jgi:hypothetical protein